MVLAEGMEGRRNGREELLRLDPEQHLLRGQAAATPPAPAESRVQVKRGWQAPGGVFYNDGNHEMSRRDSTQRGADAAGDENPSEEPFFQEQGQRPRGGWWWGRFQRKGKEVLRGPRRTRS